MVIKLAEESFGCIVVEQGPNVHRWLYRMEYSLRLEGAECSSIEGNLQARDDLQKSISEIYSSLTLETI